MGKLSTFLNNVLSSDSTPSTKPAKTEFGTAVGRQAAEQEKKNEFDLAVAKEQARRGI